MYIRKYSDPNIDPCSTPTITIIIVIYYKHISFYICRCVYLKKNVIFLLLGCTRPFVNAFSATEN